MEPNRGAAANFVHSLDSAHLIAVVTSAANEKKIDLLTAHDCFACLPAHATRLNQNIRRELSTMYAATEFIAVLRHMNAFRIGGLKPPVIDGALKGAEFLKFLEEIKDATYAFS